MPTCAHYRSHDAPMRWALMLLMLALITACGQPEPASGVAQPTVTDESTQPQVSAQPYPRPGQPYPRPGEVTAATPSIDYAPQPYPRPGEVTAATPSIDYASKVLGVVIDGNGVVLHVEPQSGAARAGIEAGDQITSINGVDFQKDREGAKSQLISTMPEDAVTLKLKKSQGDEVEVAVTRLYQGEGSSPNGATPTPVFPPNDYL